MQKAVRSICGIFVIAAIMLVIMASATHEKVFAAYDDYYPSNVRWEGTTAVWDKAFYEDEYLDYEVGLFNVTDGADELIYTYYSGKDTSVNLEDKLKSIDFSGDGYKLSLRVRSIDTSVIPNHVYDYVSADTVTMHKIKFDSMGGTSVSDMVAFEGRTGSFPDDPTKDGYAFAGWYKTNDDFETESNMWDFERDKNEGNMTLYAKWIEAEQHVHQIGGSEISFKPWARTRSLPTKGNYYLLYDIDLAYDTNISDILLLCLADHTVKCGDHQIKVNSGSLFTLLDPEDGGKITGSTNSSGAICVDGGLFTMHGGSITGNTANGIYGRGGGIRVNSGSAIMLGGSITNNTAEEMGGGVAVLGGSFELAGGTISGNKAGGTDSSASGGGAVGVIGEGASFIMSGGLITGNSSSGSISFGSALHVREGTFYVNGGTITENGNGSDAVFINNSFGGAMQISKDGAKTGAIKISGNSGGNVRNNHDEPIKVNGEIDEASEICISPASSLSQGQTLAITDGLSGNGDASIFKSDNGNYTVVDNGNGEAAFRNYWKVTYKPGDHSSGGEMDPAELRIIDEEELTFPECGYLPEDGYEFAGWKVNDNTYKKDELLKIMGNWDVTATWKASVYPIEYDLDGGSLPDGNTNPGSYTIESSDVTLAEPERKGYTFTGWTGTGIEGDTPVKNVVIKQGSQGERSYKANWEAIEYKLTYKLNGGRLAEGKSNPATYTAEDEFTLNEPERDKFVFLGWMGTGLEEETKDLAIEKGSTGNRTYIAVFEEICKDGHNWSTPEYTWSKDGSVCIAKRACSNDGCNAKETEMGEVTSEVKTPATYETKGTTTYTAAFENEAFETQTKDIDDIPVLEPEAEAKTAKDKINGLPDIDEITVADKSAIERARKAYDALTEEEKASIPAATLKKLEDAEAALKEAETKAEEEAAKKKAEEEAAKKKAAEANAKKVKTVTVNVKTVNAKALAKAVKKAKGSGNYVTKFILGKKVNKIAKKAFAKYKNVKTIVVKTRKLKKKTVKASLKGSKITKVQIKVGTKKANKKFRKSYKKIFTKKNCGRKVSIR